MNAIQTLAQTIETAILSVSRDKGIVAAKQWVSVLTPILSDYPVATGNMADWVSQGSSTSKTSGVNYKGCHNKGIFPSEQVFCNTRGKAKRPLSVVCKAVATALIKNVAYNPDRFEDFVTDNGLEQELLQLNRTVESAEKKAIYNMVIDKPVTKKVKQALIQTSQEMSQARDAGLGAKAFGYSQDIALLLAASAKRNAVKPAVPAVVKPDTPTVTKPGRKAKGKAE